MEQTQTKKTKFKNVLSLGLLTVSIFFLGFYIGANKNINIAKVKAVEESADVDMGTFWKVWSEIDKKFPEAEKVSSKDRVVGAIAGLVDSLNDPYSIYMDAEESKVFTEEIRGNFSGVGMEIGIKDGVLTVISPLKGTPAFKAGIKAGDKVLKIGDTPAANLKVEDAVKLIRGEKGTEVVLLILSENESDPREVRIIRDTIQIPTLDTELRSDGIFVIRLYSFSANSTSLFRGAIKEFIDSKSEKLILDLRGNPGGYLEAANDIASWFLPKGKVVVVEDYGGDTEPKKYRSEGYNVFGENLKLVILIDGGSASASEIVAGALQDYDRAKLVGSKSFGKGSVQEVMKITKDTLLKITVAKWLTPNGTSISETGLTPDYIVEMSKADMEKRGDVQLNKAIEILNNWYTLQQ